MSDKAIVIALGCCLVVTGICLGFNLPFIFILSFDKSWANWIVAVCLLLCCVFQIWMMSRKWRLIEN